MNLATSFLIAVGLAMDSFAVSLGVGTTQPLDQHRDKFRLAFHLGLFQALMPVLGWLAGSTINQYISSVDHWIAAGLLAYVGGKMLKEGFDTGDETFMGDPCRGRLMIVLCVATSIDALAVGLSLAMIDAPIAFPVLVIGVVTFALSLFGLYAGCRLGESFGKRMEILGGLILLLIGARILYSHLA